MLASGWLIRILLMLASDWLTDVLVAAGLMRAADRFIERISGSGGLLGFRWLPGSFQGWFERLKGMHPIIGIIIVGNVGSIHVHSMHRRVRGVHDPGRSVPVNLK